MHYFSRVNRLLKNFMLTWSFYFRNVDISYHKSLTHSHLYYVFDVIYVKNQSGLSRVTFTIKGSANNDLGWRGQEI